MSFITEDSSRLGGEINTAMLLSDLLPFVAIMLLIPLVTLGFLHPSYQENLGMMVILVGFIYVGGQGMMAGKIHRLGARFYYEGSRWERANRSPVVGIFSFLMQIPLVLLWLIGAMWIWSKLTPSSPIPIAIISLTVAMACVIPFIRSYEMRFNKDPGEPASKK